MNDAPPVAGSSLRWLTALFAPFATISAYLCFSRWPVQWFTTTSDYVGIAFAVIAFAAAALMLPLSRKAKFVVIGCGSALLAPILFVYSLLFVGLAFGDWL